MPISAPADTLQTLLDKHAIYDLLVAYCRAIDSRELDALDDIFTADAQIDHRAMGSSSGNLAERKQYLTAALAKFSAIQHLIGNVEIHIEGATATARSLCHNPMLLKQEDGFEQFSLYGLWYVDSLIKTKRGWRICRRVAERGVVFHAPSPSAPAPG